MRSAVLAIALLVAWVANGSSQTATETTHPDPILGTWKLNLAQSRYSRSEFTPRAQVEVYRETAGRIDLTLTRTRADGSLWTFKANWPAQGGLLTYETPEAGRSIVEALLRPGEWFVTQMQDGKQDVTMHKVVSKDGKTMRQTIHGVDPKGGQFILDLVFDRQ